MNSNQSQRLFSDLSVRLSFFSVTVIYPSIHSSSHPVRLYLQCLCCEHHNAIQIYHQQGAAMSKSEDLDEAAEDEIFPLGGSAAASRDET